MKENRKGYIRAGDLKQGQLFTLDGSLYRRLFQNGYMETMDGINIVAANEYSFILVHVNNSVKIFPFPVDKE